MKFNVNFSNVILQLIPGFLRKSNFIALLNSLISSLQYLNNVFYAETRSIYYYLKFNAQVIYLNKYLNDQYDPYYNRISISDGGVPGINYWFNQAEAGTLFYSYNNWDINKTYSSGEFIQFKNKVYSALSNNTRQQPDINPLIWEYDSECAWYYNNIPITGTFDYFVNIPSDLASLTNQIRASVNLFNLANKTFTINIL